MKRDFTRREFMTNGMLGLSMLALPKSIYSFGKGINEKSLDKGLFFSINDVPRIKESIELPMFKKYWDSIYNIDFDAKKKFIAAAALNRHWDNMRMIDTMITQSSFVSLVTGDKKHEELAKLGIKKVLEYKTWDYFMEKETGKPIGLQMGPDALISMSLAYDWLGDKLSQDEKDAIIKGIIEKGVPACYNALYFLRNPEKSGLWVVIPNEQIKFEANTKRWPWFINRTNLKIIPVAGLTFASVLLHGKHPEANKWLEMSRWGIETASKIYYPDGCYDEGVGYWDYSTRHIIMAVELLRRNLNIDYTKAVNFKGSIKFVMQMTAPFKGQEFATANFSDAGFNPDASAGFWVAKQFKDGLAQYTAEMEAGNRNMFAFIYYDKNTKPQPPVKKDMDVKFDVGWIISRTGWTENDSFLAFKGGNPGNHEHADRNSFIFQACGDRLLHDPMGAAYRASEAHWILRHTQSHNAVLIDGKGHFFHDGSEGTNSTIAKAVTLDYKVNEKVTSIVSDATQPYQLVNKDVKKVIRTLYFFKPDIIILVDEVEKSKEDSNIQLRFHPFNWDGKAVISDDGDSGFKIGRPYANLYGKVFSNQKVTVKNSKLDIPIGNVSYPNTPNAALQQVFPYVEAGTAEPSKKNIIVTVLSAQKSDVASAPVLNISGKKSGYLIEIEKHDGKSHFEVKMDKKYPYILKSL
jgi:hypothetical protein